MLEKTNFASLQNQNTFVSVLEVTKLIIVVEKKNFLTFNHARKFSL